MAKKYVWKKQNSSYCYVDANTGDDINGDGTMQNPFRSLGRAIRGTNYANIVCRGVFYEDLADAYPKKIMADYFGASFFEGKEDYIILANESDMIIKDCCEIREVLNISSKDNIVRCGIGSFTYSSGGDSFCPTGIVSNSPIRNGTLGKFETASHSVVVRPKYSTLSRDKINLFANGNASNVTLCDLSYDKLYEGSYISRRVFNAYLFSKFCITLDNKRDFSHCLFDKDCEFYYNSKKVELGDTYGEERLNLILAAMDEWNVPTSSRPTFTDCIFSAQDAHELFNDPDNYDFTLKLTSDAVLPNGGYIGAMPPAIHVPILDNSEGKAETWDETTASGVVTIENNEICYDPTLDEKRGEVLSKVLTLDTSKISLSAVYAMCFNNWASQNVAISEEAFLGDSYTTEDVLPIGKYVVRGTTLAYLDSTYYDGDIVTVSEDGTQFSVEEGQSATLQAVLDPNIENVCYIRTAPTAYAKIKASEGLQRGGTYLNNGNKNITYRGRTIVPKESFVAVNDTDTFTCEGDADYKVSVIFDDTRVPSQEWFSSLLFGESFVWKNKGVVQVDAEGNSISSGNPLSYEKNSNGGYSDLLTKTPINQTYVQFRISVSML